MQHGSALQASLAQGLKKYSTALYLAAIQLRHSLAYRRRAKAKKAQNSYSQSTSTVPCTPLSHQSCPRQTASRKNKSARHNSVLEVSFGLFFIFKSYCRIHWMFQLLFFPPKNAKTTFPYHSVFRFSQKKCRLMPLLWSIMQLSTDGRERI